MGNKPTKQQTNKQQKEEITYNSNVNINKMCFCKKKLQQTKSTSGSCFCCCNKYKPNKNKMQFYGCPRNKECVYYKISASRYRTCSRCFNREYKRIEDSKNDFLYTKTKANMKIISEEVGKVPAIGQRKKYMYAIYKDLYTWWIAKLNNDELTKDFNDFYDKQLQKK
eukprot:407467_1